MIMYNYVNCNHVGRLKIIIIIPIPSLCNHWVRQAQAPGVRVSIFYIHQT